MAETDAAASAASHGTFGVLGHKVGPFPVVVWGLLGFGIYYWYTRYGPGASASSTPVQNAVSAVKGALSWPAASTTTKTTTSSTGKDRDRDRKDRDRKDRDRKRPGRTRRDRDAGGQAAKTTTTTTRTAGGTETFSASAPAGASQPTGQPVSADTGQPVYWEWTHAHRSPDVAYPVSSPVPEPQQAYAPMTNGATYNTDTSGADASAGAAAALAGAAGA